MAAGDRVVLAGGGTGGHVFPALAVGEELAARGWEVSFAGRPRGLEARLVGDRGMTFHPLPARPLVGRGPLGRLAALAALGVSALRARRLLRRIDAAAVVGTGGYASAPAVVGARLAGRPALLVEPNARAGVANRWLSRFAAEAAVAHPEAGGDLRCPARVTGVPVRVEFFAVPDLDPEGLRPRLLVLGGSQGARRLNEALPGAAARLAVRHPDLAIVHQCGARHLESTREAYRREGPRGADVEVVPFLGDVAGAMAGAALLVSRAGALTLAEICAAGRPAILVPLGIAGGHQEDNARALAVAGAARVIPEPELTAAALAAALAELMADRGRLAAMGRAARALGRPDAARRIADRVEELAWRA